VDQPYGRPIDFGLTDQQIFDRTQGEVLENSTFLPAEVYAARLAARLNEALA
jgi:hypothetical protein